MADNNWAEQGRRNREQHRNHWNHDNYNEHHMGYGSNYSGNTYRGDTEDDYIQDVGREHYGQQGDRGQYFSGAYDVNRNAGGGSGGGNNNRGQSGGGHRGKGPKNYQRSEDRIREDVCERLMDDAMIDATNVEVRVQNNEVVLSGVVHNREEKRRAEDLAEAVAGVRNVENRLRVEPSSGTDTNYYREYDENGRLKRGA